ncbi:hypothetical protein AB1Y20_022276 [Prymnesium parvum]|uniref:Uncharacterized protein n=1 Tax=Prymnesium parvum TaxID=97485 RepID=A0AB34JHH0_PRYPA
MEATSSRPAPGKKKKARESFSPLVEDEAYPSSPSDGDCRADSSFLLSKVGAWLLGLGLGLTTISLLSSSTPHGLAPSPATARTTPTSLLQPPLPPPPLPPLISWLTPNPVDLSNSTCALVGGSNSVLQHNFGAQIDAHDVVVRVNRMFDASVDSFSALARKLGRRTDIFFQDSCDHNSDDFEFRHVGGDWESCRPPEKSCPFGSIVYRGNTASSEPLCTGETQNGEALRRKAASSIIAVGIEADIVVDSVLQFRELRVEGGGGDSSDGDDANDNEPTTGLHAVVLFGLACKSVDLYAFGGDGTIDGHTISADHGLAMEHELLSSLSNHRPIANMPSLVQHLWDKSNIRVIC